jgi:hypothetical protein
MQPLKPKVDRYYDDVWVPEGNIILKESIPVELRGKVDKEDWPGHFEISIKSYYTSHGNRYWSVAFEGFQTEELKITGLASRRAALEAGKVLVMAYLHGAYENGRE